MLFGESACGGGEVVVGDDHGVRAVVHRGTGDHLLHGARADGSGLPFALNGKAIRPASHDEVDAEVARHGCHDDGPAATGDVRDMVLEFDPRHSGVLFGGMLAEGRRTRSPQYAEQECG